MKIMPKIVILFCLIFLAYASDSSAQAKKNQQTTAERFTMDMFVVEI